MVSYGPNDDPITGICGYCQKVVDANGFCSTGCRGIVERLGLQGFPEIE